METLSQVIQQVMPTQYAWQRWSAIAGFIGLLLVIILILSKRQERVLREIRKLATEPPADPSGQDESQKLDLISRNKSLLSRLDLFSFLTLGMAIVAAYYLPAFQLADPILLLRLAGGSMVLIAVLVLWSPFVRSVNLLRWSTGGLVLLKATTATSAVLFILSLPASLLLERNRILMNLVFCGGLTLYREARRRRRAGDQSQSSHVGGWLVVIQFLSLVSVFAVALTVLVLAGLALTGLLNLLDPKAWLELVVFLFSSISVVYLLVYLGRRLLKARGFSWIDPPNWRVVLPHVKYLYLNFGRGPALADIIRKIYIEAIAGDGRQVTTAQIVEAAKIELPVSPHRDLVQFAIIGDPGEGDDSQLYPGNTVRGEAKSMAAKVVKSGKSYGKAGPAESSEQPLDCVLISSDVVYPAGELMDYERAVYRPYMRSTEIGEAPKGVPIYAIPGNHDWYDNLRGFMANFTYAAAHGDDRGGQRWRSNLRDLPWDWRPWRSRIWAEVGTLRKNNRLETLGGLPNAPLTQQRLPFFEIAISDVPLTVLGLDSGATGSIDRLQYAWMVDRLAEARGKNHLIVVMLSAPLYVNGEFAGPKEAPTVRVAERGELYGPREIYEQLRKYRVKVVIAGDTHAYQRYEVSFMDQQGSHTMYHIVNGGGGAYLSCPMDLGWIDFDWHQKSGLKLSQRVVYQAQARTLGARGTEADEAVLLDIFPSASEMLQKFVWSADMTAGAWLERQRTRFQTDYNSFVLSRGFTNALDHDFDPLLQSYLIVEMQRVALGRWELRIVPWFRMLNGSEGEQREPVAQRDRQLTIEFEPASSGAEWTQATIPDHVERAANELALGSNVD